MKSENDYEAASGQIVVVGASAGGLKAITALVRQLPADFQAPILIVQHIAADAIGNVLRDTLNNLGTLKCLHAAHGTVVKAGHIYLAPSNHHLMIDKNGKLLVTKGAQENRSRPAIDPLFRSAAAAFGNRATGVILTGYLDDGTSGLIAIQRCGGTCIVQDPADADYPDMPVNALNQISADYCLPIAQMGSVLTGLLQRKLPKNKAIPKDIIREVGIVERIQSDLASVNSRRAGSVQLSGLWRRIMENGPWRFRALPLPYGARLYGLSIVIGTKQENRGNDVDRFADV